MSTPLPTYADIVAAARRIDGCIVKTPVLTSHALNQIAGNTLFIKAECLQVTGSFKIRGASNRLLQVDPDKRAKGVVAFSSGNHARGVARAARRLGMPALIVMPHDAPKAKTQGVLDDGATIHFHERGQGNREAIAAELAVQRGATLVPSFDDSMIVAGQGSCGLEFVDQLAAIGVRLDHLICCVGGGGLVCGMALALYEHKLQTRIWTAEPEGHDDWRRSLQAGRIVANPPGSRSLCDAILTPKPGDIPWRVGAHLLSGGIAVSDDEVCEAMRLAFRHLRLVVEPGGAVALAAALFRQPQAAREKSVGVVLTGGNVDAGLFAHVLDKGADKPSRRKG